MSFRSNHQCYGLNHGIVCDNVPILHTHMHLGMASFSSHEKANFIADHKKRFNTSQRNHQWFNT